MSSTPNSTTSTTTPGEPSVNRPPVRPSSEQNNKRIRSSGLKCNVLIASPDDDFRSKTISGLSSVRLDNPFGLTFIPALNPEQTMETIKNDGDVQIVVLDIELGEQLLPELTTRINSFRPELSVYVVFEDDDDEVNVEEILSANLVDGYFHRADQDFYEWFRIFSAEIAQAAKTPFYDELKR